MYSGLSFELTGQGLGHGSDNGNGGSAEIAEDAYTVGFDFVRDDRAAAGCADVRVRSAERSRPGPRSYGNFDCHGGYAFYGHQLRAHGAGVSERGIGVHVCGAGDPRVDWVCDGLEHGDGLHCESIDLRDLVRGTGA